MNYLNENDWSEFRDKFPSAFNFLVRRSNANEYTILTMKPIESLTEYEKKRVNELSHLF